MPNPICPTNQKAGKAVDSLILKAMLDVSLTHVTSPAYYFCRDSSCPTVYYSADGSQCFSETDLREKVFQKHVTEDDVLVCYCFQHTVGSIRKEIEQTGVSTVVDSITAAIQDGQCACDIRNPQGDCCLGNVRALVEREISRVARNDKIGF
jgi:hypothetical protein